MWNRLGMRAGQPGCPWVASGDGSCASAVAPVWLCLYTLGGYGRTTQLLDQPIAIGVCGRAHGGLRVEIRTLELATCAAVWSRRLAFTGPIDCSVARYGFGQ